MPMASRLMPGISRCDNDDLPYHGLYLQVLLELLS
jgi:hypothetical protein